ncbi:hypothetical protein [uncultured Imperialibacter sp.]|uniref:hypothetical protein n=1 Tax=uncultured Imperialibacter sp. TaxID=1672639 RepID=UPI0030DBF667|tara:strand:- start:19897 stop:20814 length:918 start_codon:yes stop_codon:yes gene_type:complete
MHRVGYLSIFFFCLAACSKTGVTDRPSLTPDQKTKIESFSQELVRSINGFDFSVINNSWDYQAFKDRISDRVNRTQKSVLSHIFEKELKSKIKDGNAQIVLRVNTDNGKVSPLRLNQFDHHSELLLLLTFDNTFDFFKYRIEYINNQPRVTDFYSYADNRWFSEKLIDLLKLSTKYDAFSSDRHEANAAIAASEQALILGDTLDALYNLYEVPGSHQEGNWLSLRKINLAVTLGDSVLAEVLTAEHDSNNSLYINYLYNYYFGDTTELDLTYKLLATELGDSQVLDSLIHAGYLWNTRKNDNTNL